MPQKKYADTDFFLALMKDSDWLKDKAKKIYGENKENIFVSPFTIVEIMIVCKREDVPVKETLIQISRIAKLDTLTWDIFYKSCDFMEKGATIFDSLLMAFCSEDDQIISSDKIYEKFGFDVIDLKK
ncbi:pilus assembly protein [Candidatus Pacearchaeota archaeon CG10_big_fil_rev_8_21_14_0_10_34_76]|nr:MAG: pilus assembly protein [Candidatus Pacearchaeota archaeon CG10_big_fil_rev_8_21_14_0_10_34_76]